MKTWKTEKSRLERNGVEFPNPRQMAVAEKVELDFELEGSILNPSLKWSCQKGMTVWRKLSIFTRKNIIVPINTMKNGAGYIVRASRYFDSFIIILNTLDLIL